jgi:hypothetical protein
MAKREMMGDCKKGRAGFADGGMAMVPGRGADGKGMGAPSMIAKRLLGRTNQPVGLPARPSMEAAGAVPMTPEAPTAMKKGGRCAKGIGGRLMSGAASLFLKEGGKAEMRKEDRKEDAKKEHKKVEERKEDRKEERKEKRVGRAMGGVGKIRHEQYTF